MEVLLRESCSETGPDIMWAAWRAWNCQTFTALSSRKCQYLSNFPKAAIKQMSEMFSQWWSITQVWGYTLISCVLGCPQCNDLLQVPYSQAMEMSRLMKGLACSMTWFDQRVYNWLWEQYWSSFHYPEHSKLRLTDIVCKLSISQLQTPKLMSHFWFLQNLVLVWLWVPSDGGKLDTTPQI